MTCSPTPENGKLYTVHRTRHCCIPRPSHVRPEGAVPRECILDPSRGSLACRNHVLRSVDKSSSQAFEQRSSTTVTAAIAAHRPFGPLQSTRSLTRRRRLDFCSRHDPSRAAHAALRKRTHGTYRTMGRPRNESNASSRSGEETARVGME